MSKPLRISDRLAEQSSELLRWKKERLKPFADAYRVSKAPADQKAAATYELILRELRRRQSDPDGGLLEFIRYFWHILEPATPFVEGWVMECLCAHLAAITSKETVVINGVERLFNRFLANVPPGFSKSLTVNVFWPAHEWGPMGLPHLRYVAFSYAAELTERDNQKFRDLICSQEYQELWGHVYKVIGDGKVRVTNDKTGFKFASSMGGVGTGERGDRVLCLPGTERVLTDQGWLPIAKIVEQHLPVKIAGLNHATGVIEWQEIEAYERNQGNEIVEIACEEGTLRCTRDHPVFVQGRGYARADSIQSGEQVVWAGSDFPLPSLPCADTAQAEPSSEVLQHSLSRGGRESFRPCSQQPPVRHLWKAGLQATSTLSALGCSLLQPAMLWARQYGRQQSGLSWGRGYSDMRVVRKAAYSQTKRGKARYLLLVLMRCAAALGAISKETARYYCMPCLCAALQALVTLREVLLNPMQGRCARLAYAGQRQRPVCSWGGAAEVPARLDQDAQSADQSQRRQLLSALCTWPRPASSIGRASYRLRQDKPKTRQSHHALPVLPRSDARQRQGKSALETRTVRSVKAVGREAIVYNVRVGPHRNYYASGFLVHNCDDIHKVKGTESDDLRKSIVQWVREGMSNRLNNLRESVIVIIMQRLHEEDTSGAIMKHNGDEYCQLIVPMEYEHNRHFTHLPGWADPRSEENELAWPDRFAITELASFKRNAYLWSGQYQQRPSPRGGGMFKETWWQAYEVPPSKLYEFEPLFTLASLDTAFKQKEENDYSALTVWSVYNDPKTMARRIMLVDAWKKRLPMHGERIYRESGESEVAFMRRAAKSWGLVEWVSHTCTRRRINRLIIEDASRGHDVNAEIQRLYGDRDWGTVLIPATGNGDKWSRAAAIVDLFTDHMIYAPGEFNGEMWEWREFASMVIDDMCSFPRGAHDDIVDTVSMALRYLRQNGWAIRRDETAFMNDELAKYRPPSKALYNV